VGIIVGIFIGAAVSLAFMLFDGYIDYRYWKRRAKD
jgi:hypothetical protein